MTTLVTGAGGFIGSHLVDALVARGDDVRAFLHYNALQSRGNLSADVEVVWGDVRDPQSVSRAVRGCDQVFHLAALISVPWSYVAPEAFVLVNTVGTLNVLEACREIPLVITSTSEVYGSAQTPLITTSHPINPQSPYAASKVGADALAAAAHRSFGTPVVTLRPFNTYGPRQSPRAIIPTIISQLRAGPVVRLGSVSPMRDFLWVGDTVRGFLAASTAAPGAVIQIGSGTAISIRDLVAKIGVLMGVDPIIESDEQRRRPDNSEVFRLVCDRAEAWLKLKWLPSIDLDAGLALTIDALAPTAVSYAT